MDGNVNKQYGDNGYVFIFFCATRSIPFTTIARALGKKANDVEKSFERICQDATDYPDKKEYDVYPLADLPYTSVNESAGEYIYFQHIVRKKPLSIVCMRLGIEESVVQKYLDGGKWKKFAYKQIKFH